MPQVRISVPGPKMIFFDCFFQFISQKLWWASPGFPVGTEVHCSKPAHPAHPAHPACPGPLTANENPARLLTSQQS